MCKYTHYLGPNMQAVTETSYGNHISCNSDLTRCISSVFKSSEEEKKLMLHWPIYFLMQLFPTIMGTDED